MKNKKTNVPMKKKRTLQMKKNDLMNFKKKINNMKISSCDSKSDETGAL